MPAHNLPLPPLDHDEKSESPRLITDSGAVPLGGSLGYCIILSALHFVGDLDPITWGAGDL